MLNYLTNMLGSITKKVEYNRIFDEAKSLFDAKEYKKALPLMKEAAEMGSPFALAHLGVMFMKGLGVPCDWEKAAELLEMTINLENYRGTEFQISHLKSNIGMIHAIGGYGLKRDLEKAKEYLKAAADDGDEKSAEFLTLVIGKKGIFGQKERPKPEIRW